MGIHLISKKEPRRMDFLNTDKVIESQKNYISGVCELPSSGLSYASTSISYDYNGLAKRIQDCIWDTWDDFGDDVFFDFDTRNKLVRLCQDLKENMSYLSEQALNDQTQCLNELLVSLNEQNFVSKWKTFMSNLKLKCAKRP